MVVKVKENYEKIRNIKNNDKSKKYLEKYISFNTQERYKAKNDFEKDFYKLLYNAFYGKTISNST